jgi:hypothetical protein
VNSPNKPSAKIVGDSISPAGARITTMVVVMHRFVLAEFNTHRRFSRNSASSRAIPIHKRLREVWESLAWPVEWGSNKSGMQAGEELKGWRLEACKAIWRGISLVAIASAWSLWKLSLPKQVTNRLLEPFLWHTAVVTSTEWQNFFNQRCSKLAQPEIRELAEAMELALKNSVPVKREIHLPFVSDDDLKSPELGIGEWIKISIARCARLTYISSTGADRVSILRAELDRYEMLRTAKPPHWSPFEHVAYAGTGVDWKPINMDQAFDNLVGWQSERYVMETLKYIPPR